ncbi:MAG: hypothetical protein ACTS27_11500, partial [Phycisphaerales bacterium]
VFAVLLPLLVATPALAQDAAPPTPVAPPANHTVKGVSDELWEPGRWTLQLEPTVWLAALGGDIKAGAGPRVDVSDIDGDADTAHAAASLRGLYRSGPWTVMADGFWLDFNEGDNGSSLDYTLWSVDASVGYQLWEWKRAAGNGDTPDADSTGVAVRLIPYAGLRLIAPDISTTIGGASNSGSDEFLHPIVGLRLEIEIFDRVSLDTGADVGGFDLFGEDAFTFDWTLNIRAHLTENVSALIGFRQMFMDVESDDVLLDGSAGGLMAGLTIRF